MSPHVQTVSTSLISKLVKVTVRNREPGSVTELPNQKQPETDLGYVYVQPTGTGNRFLGMRRPLVRGFSIEFSFKNSIFHCENHENFLIRNKLRIEYLILNGQNVFHKEYFW